MKTKQIILFVVFILTGAMVMAQPLPPTTPQGNPVPVEGFLHLLPVVLVSLGYKKLRKTK